MELGVGLGDPCGSLPTWDSVNRFKWLDLLMTELGEWRLDLVPEAWDCSVAASWTSQGNTSVHCIDQPGIPAHGREQRAPELKSSQFRGGPEELV